VLLFDVCPVDEQQFRGGGFYQAISTTIFTRIRRGNQKLSAACPSKGIKLFFPALAKKELLSAFAPDVRASRTTVRRRADRQSFISLNCASGSLYALLLKLLSENE